MTSPRPASHRLRPGLDISLEGGIWLLLDGVAEARIVADRNGDTHLAAAIVHPRNTLNGRPGLRVRGVDGEPVLIRQPDPPAGPPAGPGSSRDALLLARALGQSARAAGGGVRDPVDAALLLRADAHAAAASAHLSDLQDLEALQRSLLQNHDPAAVERATGFRIEAVSHAAHRVNGDFHHVLRDRNGHLWGYVGDASGHGLVPAFFGTYVCSIIRLAIELDAAHHDRTSRPWRAPARVLQYVAGMVEAMRHDYFATAIVFRIDPGRGNRHPTISWSQAGHPDPVLVDPVPVETLQRCDSRTPSGTALGLQNPQHHYPVSRASLPPGATAVLTTDGIADAVDPGAIRMRIAGNPRRTVLAHATSILQSPHRDAARQAASHPDDRTVMVVRHTR